ncbi:pyridoxal phosphate-dependent aminotransferase [Streptomyces phaeochromogenes]|uniref:pyridoxal phosphate-dependent aminotransferase n=1 Tax=Streptomyces phaeochromogenes TaxID=1923 RepID=UPI00386EC7B9|nr:pyridoxal phosphate-dependent aminotransferase [Streptomyces phaeochromogenes]
MTDAVSSPHGSAPSASLSPRLRGMPEGLGRWLAIATRSNTVDLALGTPEFPTAPRSAVHAASHAMRQGHNQYDVPAGNSRLRASVACHLRGQPDPDTEMTVTVGATEALSATLLALLDEGDEVVLTEPYYPNFLSALALAGGRPRFVPLSPPDWAFDPERFLDAIGPRTRLVLLNSPHNPTGRLLSPEAVLAVGTRCARNGVWLVCDEVYAAYAYDGRAHVSVCDQPGLEDIAVSIGSFSKSHALSGWRLGYVRAAPRTTRAVRLVHEALTGGAPSPLQRGLTAVLDEAVRTPREAMQRRRDEAVAMFTDAGLVCTNPEGGCYFTAEQRDGSADGDQLAQRLLTRAGVAVLPGSLFITTGDPRMRRFVRVAFNRSRSTLAAARTGLSGFAAAPPDMVASPAAGAEAE